MEQTKSMNLEMIKNRIVNGLDDYDRDAKAYAIDEVFALLGDEFEKLADVEINYANYTESDIAAGRIPEWKIGAMMDKVKRLRIKARVLRLWATVFHNYVYNIESPQADTLEGSSNGGITQ